ncbi:hydantoinase/oxoprolinase family protein [Hyphomicrobium sp.]|jgi:probable H4MPT-linked C1 transfer pathway protein|uniref:hydantoinase/oxoprolinase family protein n=1 Tax=Hyphomicrobium sp. TaxID=82 RepID=UPI002BA13834|nr:hydantoinase/oxoprolinase family protein [Hyphomicrobium sp.]HVZ03702.1 hydantoinase/oxoprolinase family protein [Hyphomicrobium sp.]
MTIVAGYDVGGAHLKVARVENGRLADVRQIVCPLWQGLDRLDSALAEAQAVTDGAAVHAVTMTAELTEIFESREQGVSALTERLRDLLKGEIRIFAGLKGFTDVATARGDPLSAASANFLATARLVAERQPRSLLIDMGSTTTDIIACDRPQGLTDAERLHTGELVYTGLTRTPVPSIATRAPLAGEWQGLARDAFATMADVQRILGDLPDDADLHVTTDGRGKSLAESLARFARGFGRDAEMRHLATWQTSAAYIAERQLRAIHDGVLQVQSRPGIEIASVVTAGIGAKTAAKIAERLSLPCSDFGTLIGAPDAQRLWATRCAPAVAVALLVKQ